ncbi:hypothetical protein ACTHQW_11620 [Dietzia maris]
MSRTPRASLIAAATLAIAAAATPAAAMAQNVIPGDLDAGKTVITSLSGVDIAVTQPDSASVRFVMTNNSGRNLTCNGPANNSGIGATATTARVAQAAVQYYANFPYKPDPKDSFGSTGNVGAGDGDLTVDIGWAPILGFLPTGSIAPFLGDSYAARDWISSQHYAATMKGQTGTTPSFSLNSGAAPLTRTISLGPPSNGVRDRDKLDAGVYLVCTSGSGNNLQAFAFAGYENGPPSPTNEGTLPIGSTGNR